MKRHDLSSGATPVATPPIVAGCPFDPSGAEQLLNPHPWFAAARATAPIFYLPEVDEWWVVSYEDCLTVLRSTDTYSSRHVVRFQPFPELDAALSDGHPMSRPLVNADPPGHTRLRKLAQKAFTPRAVHAYEPALRKLANDLLDEFAADGSVDLVQQFAQPLTIQAICGIVGVPPEAATRGKNWIGSLEKSAVGAPPMADGDRESILRDVVDFDETVRAIVADRRESPTDDLISAFVTARSDDGAPSLTNSEVVGLVANILAAGFENTASAIGATVYFLLDRGEWGRVATNRSLIATSVEETLRYDNPVRGLTRYVTRDALLGGIEIPKGSTVMIGIGGAMRDANVFSHPDEFDLDRPDLNQHYGFGKWTHFCLGAPLARLEAIVALDALMTRIPNLRLAGGEKLESRWPNRGISPLTGLRLEWTRPESSGR
jgi:cytochrome P450